MREVWLVAALGLGFLAARALQAQPVFINELMSSNGATLADENGDSPDWIELYNAGPAALDLAGYGLSDDAGAPFKWRFRDGVLAPGAHLLVFASGKDRQPGAVAPIEPASVPGLKVWLRADSIGINDATQVRVSGASRFVTRWADVSGHANDARQAAEPLQPLLIAGAAGLGGLPAVRFDGVNDLLRLGAVPAQDHFTLIVVARTVVPHEIDPESASGVGGVSGQCYLFGAAHGGDFNAGAGLSVGTNGVSVYEHGSNYMPALAVYEGAVGSGFVVLSVLYTGRRPSLFLQGHLVRAGLTSPRAVVRAPVEIGSGSYGAFQGELAEMLLFERALEDAERRGVEESLARKYGLTLPGYHHTNFQLRSGGERLRLTRPDGILEDEAPAVAIPRDVSYGRQPDGGSAWFYFERPTPGASNLTPGSAELLPAPQFSHPAGFYSNDFRLALSVLREGAVIRYTLDGSEPTESSTIYTTPLAITNRADVPNQLSLIATVPGYQPPAARVFKGIVVRAKTFKAGALPGATVTRSYFVHPKGRARYTVPVVSLATAPANFFDPVIGIYVPGHAPGGNYSQRGEEWERPVHVELFETDGSVALAQPADVKIHGNTSQHFPIKGLDLDATGGGRQPFRHRLFPDRSRDAFEHILLRPSGHDHHLAFMRDELMQSLAAEFGMESQAARLVVVFLNGEYWGLHYLKEKQDPEFVAFYGRTSPDQIDYLEGYAAARAGDTRHYDAMIQFLATRGARDPADYAHLQTLMEAPNYIDYKVAEIFCYRWDIGNHRLWRPRSPEGRWRWLQFDNDVGWGGFWASQPAWSFNMLEAATTPSGSLHDHNNETTTFLLRRLLENDTFKRDFINRFADLLNWAYLPAHTLTRINALAAALEPEMAEHIARWRAPGSLAEWRNQVQYLRTYAINRPQHARQHLMQRFALRGTVTLSLATSDTNCGSILINTLRVSAPANEPWSGVYFKDNPITLHALPNPGCRFAGWHGLLGVASNRVTLLLNGDLALRADFTRAAPVAPVLAWTSGPANGVVTLGARGEPDQRYLLESSLNLTDWSPLHELSLPTNGHAEVPSHMEPNPEARFFRLRWLQ